MDRYEIRLKSYSTFSGVAQKTALLHFPYGDFHINGILIIDPLFENHIRFQHYIQSSGYNDEEKTIDQSTFKNRTERND